MEFSHCGFSVWRRLVCRQNRFDPFAGPKRSLSDDSVVEWDRGEILRGGISPYSESVLMMRFLMVMGMAMRLGLMLMIVRMLPLFLIMLMVFVLTMGMIMF